jgi:hypothetical protein
MPCNLLPIKSFGKFNKNAKITKWQVLGKNVGRGFEKLISPGFLSFF